MKKLVIPSIMLLLSSCGSTPYLPPSGGPTSTLVMPSPKTSYSLFGGVSSSKVRFAIDQGNSCGKFGEPLKPSTDIKKPVEIVIPSDKKIFIRAAFTMGNSSCVPVVSFFAQENKRYTVVPGYQGKSCSVVVLQSTGINKLETVKLDRAYVDTWSGLKVCTNKNEL